MKSNVSQITIKRVVEKARRVIRKVGCWSALCVLGLALWGGGSVSELLAAEQVLSDFNGTGFNYTFSGFNQTTGSASVRLSDLVDDSGGAGVSFAQPMDFSSLSDARFSVEMFTNPGNEAGLFDIELIDSSDRTGKWSFGIADLQPGVSSSLVSSTTLANPTHGIGDFHNLDLSSITAWQVLGTFSSPAPFDMNFDRVLISDSLTAPPPYAGAEPDAPWRAEAASRIEANRQAPLQIKVTDSEGNAISGANVSVRMIEHEFGFGSAVQARRLQGNAQANATYKQKTAELFNLATIENALKWPPWEGEWGNDFAPPTANAAVDWLNARQIDVRGHTLVWPGYSNLPNPVQAILDSAPLDESGRQQLRTAIEDHIDEIGQAFAGKLSAWDVINETRTNHDVMDALEQGGGEGNLAMVEWFEAIQSIDPAAKRYINDFGILSSAGGTHTFNQQQYFDTVQYLIDNNTPIEGIGFQGHFSQGDLTGPEQLWTIFDRFEQLGLDMQITEFDFGTSDEQLQADYTRDFLTAVFAHKAIDDFLFWGFWEDAHWRPDAALFNSDWSIKPNGQAFLDLVFDEWWTEEDLIAALAGEAALRGFKGEYEITVMVGGEERVVNATLTDDGLMLEVMLPIASADFDADGNVDAEDLALWTSSFGSDEAVFQSAGDTDGDLDSDGADFLRWQRQASTPILSSASVPEPTTMSLMLVLAIAGASLRRVV